MKPGTYRLIKRAISSILLFMITGCAENYLPQGLPLLEGKPVSQAIHYFGPPTEKKKDHARTIYSWINEKTANFLVPNANSYPAIIQGSAQPMADSYN